MQPEIRYADGSWSVALEDGDPLEVDSREDALAIVEQSEWFAETLEIKHEEKWKLAPGRWVDAAAEEDMPAAHDGSRVFAQLIDEMVRNLADADTAPPIDGAGVSDPHETIRNGDAKAAGRVFAGVRVDDEDGRPHLWLWIRTTEEVDQQIDNHEWAHGSIAFLSSDRDRYTDEEIGARLISYALTNFPFTGGLEPHAPRARSMTTNKRAGETLAFTRSREIMPSNRRKQTAADIAARGEIMDKLKELAAFLGLELDDAMEPWGPIMDRITALQSAAKVEEIVDAGEPAAESEESERAAVRAVAGMEGEALEVWVSDALAVLGAIFGDESLDPAALLDMLKVSQDAFKGALGGAPAAEDAGPGGQDEEAERAGAAARAEVIGLRAQLDAARKEASALREVQRSRDIADHIDASFNAAKLSPPQGKDRAELERICRTAGDGWKDIVSLALRGANVPPSGVRTEPAKPTQHQEVDASKAIAAARAELKIREPELTNKQLRARSYELAKQRCPEAFRAERDAD